MKTSVELHTAFAQSRYEHVENFLEHDVDIETLRHLRTSIAIEECGESLVPISEGLVLADPHPYIQAGAPYGHLSPWQVRSSVAKKLSHAQGVLNTLRPGFRLFIFDAYRPISVQAYMIVYECQRLAKAQLSADFAAIDQQQQSRIRSEVLQFWAAPNDDPATPPPHSTGAAVDVTIIDTDGAPLDMGTEIDNLTLETYPSYFAEKTTEQERRFHAHRTLLYQVMRSAGFYRHPIEWWHFSYGDQFWALMASLQTNGENIPAIYGRV